jgi:electron transfer flavoprotein beta subunit
MKIVVMVKQVPDTEEARRLDPVSGVLDREASTRVADEIDERALEAALGYRDAHKGTEVVVLSMGPEATTQTLRRCLSMGADSAVHVLDNALAGADVVRTSATLAAALKITGFDLVIAGNESTDGRGGVVPAMVAEHLALPILDSLSSAVIAEHSVVGERGTEHGSMIVHAQLPALISVTEGFPEARFPSFKGIMTAKKKPIVTMSLADLGIDPEEEFAALGRSVVSAVQERPARAAGRKVTDAGDAGIELAEFLAASHLI